MKQRELYKKVQLLKAGQVVQINGDFFRAINLGPIDSFGICNECDLDSICHDDVLEVCCEMESAGSNRWRLKLAHPV